MGTPRADEAETVRIGEAARRTGLTPRTLRYYEEMGLIRTQAPEGRSRRYSQSEIDRLTRIRELQDLLGLSLEEIRAMLEAEDAIEALRTRFRSDTSPESQRRVVEEAIEVNARLLAPLDTRIERIERFREEVRAKGARQRRPARAGRRMSAPRPPRCRFGRRGPGYRTVERGGRCAPAVDDIGGSGMRLRRGAEG